MSETSATTKQCETCGITIKPRWTCYFFDGITICPFCYNRFVKDSNPDIHQLKSEIANLEAENAVLIKRLWDYEHQASDERIRDEK